MEFTASQIAGFINGRIIGDENTIITGVSPIESGEEGHLSFIAQDKFAGYLETTACAVLIVSEHLLEDKDYKPTIIALPDAYAAFQVLMNLYQSMRETKKMGIESGSFVHETATVAADAYVAAFAYVSEKASVGSGTEIFPHVFLGKNVKIGENCRIASGVKIHDYCVVGDHCIIHSNTVIGSDGFGFAPDKDGLKKIPQLGNVVIENNVEIGSNCSIDRGTIGSTVIGEGTKLDNLLQIAHNVKLGKNNVIAAQTGIAGSTTMGDWNMIGGQAGLAGHIHLGNYVKIQGQSGVNYNMKDGEVVYGSPAFSASEYRRNYVHFRNLSAIVKRIDDLEKKISGQEINE